MKAKFIPISADNPRVNEILTDTNLLYAALRRDPSLVVRTVWADPKLWDDIVATLHKPHGKKGRPPYEPIVISHVKMWRDHVTLKHKQERPGKPKAYILHSEIAALMEDFYPITARGVSKILATEAKKKKTAT